MRILAKTVAAAAVALVPLAAAAAPIVEVSATGPGVGSVGANGNFATVTFDITYQPFGDGTANPSCETSFFECVDEVTIDLLGGVDTNAAADPMSFAFLGTSPVDRDEFVFTLNDDDSELNIDFGGDSFDPGNQLRFDIGIRNLGDNSGGAFGARGVTGSVLFNDGTFLSGVFQTVNPTTSVLVGDGTPGITAPVPLPAAGVLLLAGLGGLGALRRRG